MTEVQNPALEALLALKGTTISLAELLQLFGTRRRTYQTVPVISEALRAAGLTTVPSFATCGQRATLLVAAEEVAAIVDDPDEDDEELAAGTLPQHSFKIGDIPCARAGLSSVGPGAGLSQVIYLMQSKNYSQVPVIAGAHDLWGVVTWRSVAARHESGQKPTLANSMVTEPLPVAEVHQDLFAYLTMLTEHGYLLVRANDGTFCGIITAADMTNRFHETARPFFLVGEIEFRLRKWLGAKLSTDAVRAVQKNGKKTGDVADLMFGDYVKLLKIDQPDGTLRANAEANWEAIGSNTNRTQFVQDLIQVKNIRNRIAHFDSEPLTSEGIKVLTEFSGLLKSQID